MRVITTCWVVTKVVVGYLDAEPYMLRRLTAN